MEIENVFFGCDIIPLYNEMKEYCHIKSSIY